MRSVGGAMSLYYTYASLVEGRSPEWNLTEEGGEMNLCNLGVFGSMILAVTLTAWGCSSSEPRVSGQGPEGISNALVCLDLNNNFTCDPGEPATRTDAGGNYSLLINADQMTGRRLLWVADDRTVDATTGLSSHLYFTMASLKNRPQVISVFTTILTAQESLDEIALKKALRIEEDASLLGGYVPGGEIDTYIYYLRDFYAGLYGAAAATHGTTPSQNIEKAVTTMLSNPARLVAYVEQMTSPPPSTPPPLLQDPPTSTLVGEEIFQSIPIDAATMSFGVGMDEITRKVVSGSYCLDIPEQMAIPELAISQNTRNYLFRLIKSEKDLRELLNVGGGLDLGTSVVQGSLEGRFINEFRSNANAIFALIKAEYILSGYKLFGVGLAPNYLLEDSNRASYVSNYEAFRKACGDRYLDQITTGGAYYGMLKITTADSTSKQDLQVALDGKYGKAGISVSVKGDLKSSVEEALKNTNVAITVGSRGVSPQYLGLKNPNDQLIDNLEKFFEAAEAFMSAISDGNNECHDDTLGPKKCAYTASFADYATISGGVPRDQTQVKNLNFVTRLMGQYEDYKILGGIVDDIMINEPDYNWGRSDLDPDDIWWLKGDLTTRRLIMDAAFRKCTTDFVGCTDNPQAASLPTFNEIIMDLPKLNREYARHCQDLQRLFGPTDRSAATVYLSGDRQKPFTISCTEMDTSEPKAFLNLVNTSTTAAPSYNMAQYVNPDGSLVTSVYNKLGVNINFRDLEIVNDQENFIETVSTAAEDSPTAADNFAYARLGSAVDCYASTGLAKSNIDLTNTRFQLDVQPADAPEGVLDNRLKYVTDAHPGARYEWVPEYMSWDEADAHAKSKGGYLAVIDSLEEWNTVFDMMKRNYVIDTWLGLKRTDLSQPTQYQQFQWITTGKNLTSAEVKNYFYPGEPNNANNNQGCVRFWWGKGFLLDDVHCTYRIPSLIEYDLSVPAGNHEFYSNDVGVNLNVNGGQQGVCSEIRPSTNVIRLKYKP